MCPNPPWLGLEIVQGLQYHEEMHAVYPISRRKHHIHGHQDCHDGQEVNGLLMHSVQEFVDDLDFISLLEAMSNQNLTQNLHKSCIKHA